MKKSKKTKLRAAGWRVGTVAEFLGLTPAESMLIEVKLALAREVQRRRTLLGLTQTSAARRIGSSQSRFAKMEASDGSVSLDLLVRALFELGASRKDVATVLRGKVA